MCVFKGTKEKGATRYSRVSITTEVPDVVTIYAYNGYFRQGETADVSPATARAIAAALIKAADEADGK
jgi:hypothetical protein